MNSYHPIRDVIGRLESDFDWSHSFIRECYFTTSRNICEFAGASGEIIHGDAGGPQEVRLAVACGGNTVDTGLDFIFRGVGPFSIQKLNELSFYHQYDRHAGHLVRFTGAQSDRECYIFASSVVVRFLGRRYLGPGLIVGFELPTSEAHEAKKIEGCWRQCGNCCNAWEESPKVEFSRCPDCGEVTRLKT